MLDVEKQVVGTCAGIGPKQRLTNVIWMYDISQIIYIYMYIGNYI